MSNHIVIAGTGRAGTTFLVKLFTNMGFETGFSREQLKVHEKSRAGLEINLLKNFSPPYIVKDPSFFEYADKIFEKQNMVIDCLIVPIRDLKSAAESRRVVEKELSSSGCYKDGHVPGGLIGTSDPSKQEEVLLKSFYKLLYQSSKTSIPIILLHFPGMVSDPLYLYDKLSPILKNIDYEIFNNAFKSTVDLSMVNKFSENDSDAKLNYKKENINSIEKPVHLISCQLFYDLGKGFNERSSIIKEFNFSNTMFEFVFNESTSIKRVRFDPVDEHCIIKLKKVEIWKTDGHSKELKNIQSNATFENNHIFYFNTVDPQFIIFIGDIVKKISFELDFIEIGRDVANRMIRTLKKELKVAHEKNYQITSSKTWRFMQKVLRIKNRLTI